MKILIVGASGGTGRQLVLRALARGHSVRAWSRYADELALSHPRLEHTSGEVTDASTVFGAVRGVDAVISALGSVRGLEKTSVCSEGTARIVDAMHAHRVRKLIAVTSMGTTDKLGPVHVHLFDPLLFRGIYDDKREQERIVSQSGLEWTIVRPGRLTDSPSTSRTEVVLDGPLPGVLVSRAAVARFALEQVGSDRYAGLAPYLVERAIVPWHKILTLGTDGRRWRGAA
jgi:nucleoside-diphosphate-sugar epimerase